MATEEIIEETAAAFQPQEVNPDAKLPDPEEEKRIIDEMVELAEKSTDFFNVENERKRDDARVYADVVVFNDTDTKAMTKNRALASVNPLPLYVNAAMNSRGRKPGEYPSAGPLAHLATVWKCGAPTVDMLSPDIYDTGFKSWAAQYALPGNRLFIPESRCCEDSGVRALYVMGEYQAAGCKPYDSKGSRVRIL